MEVDVNGINPVGGGDIMLVILRMDTNIIMI